MAKKEGLIGEQLADKEASVNESELIKLLESQLADDRVTGLTITQNLIVLHGNNFAQKYPLIESELLNACSDKIKAVRLAAFSCSRDILMTNPSEEVSRRILSVLETLLSDDDDELRVDVVSEVYKASMDCFVSSDLLSRATKQLHDDEVLVSSSSLRSLLDLYKDYCTRFSVGTTLFNEHIEIIPCKLLKNEEIKPQSMDLVIADLFPLSLTIESCTRHWVYMFSEFDYDHLNALISVLSLKRRLRLNLQHYLVVWNQEEISPNEEVMEKTVTRMCSCFPDPANAKDCFKKLEKLQDDETLRMLEQLLQDGNDAEAMKVAHFRGLGYEDKLSEFLHLLSVKCSFNIFTSDHVRYILRCLSDDREEDKKMKKHQVKLLVTILGAFPSLLKGSQRTFQRLISTRKIPVNADIVDLLAYDGRDLDIDVLEMYHSLYPVCIEGTRQEARLCVRAITELARGGIMFHWGDLNKSLLRALRKGQNAPTVLQSLGCLGQYCAITPEAEEAVSHYISEGNFEGYNSECGNYCELKVLAVKALVKSYLPYKSKSTDDDRPLNLLLDIILQMRERYAFSASSSPCEHHKVFIQLAAAKSVLRLSGKRDSDISSNMFRLTASLAKENSEICRSLIMKIHSMLGRQPVATKYVCLFSLVASDPKSDLRIHALQYLEEYFRKFNQGPGMPLVIEEGNSSVYLLVFLIHLLVHESAFPGAECRKEQPYAAFLRPIFVTLQALMNVTEDPDHVFILSSAYWIFLEIKKTKDAVNNAMTSKLHLLADVGIQYILNSPIEILTDDDDEDDTEVTVWLPESMYEADPSETEANADYEEFIRKLLVSVEEMGLI